MYIYIYTSYLYIAMLCSKCSFPKTDPLIRVWSQDAGSVTIKWYKDKLMHWMVTHFALPDVTERRDINC